jgi:hypothetical protein
VDFINSLAILALAAVNLIQFGMIFGTRNQVKTLMQLIEEFRKMCAACPKVLPPGFGKATDYELANNSNRVV